MTAETGSRKAATVRVREIPGGGFFRTTLCPYCSRPFEAGGGRTVDHVFAKAWGGRLTIGACDECNSFVGSEVEGPFDRPDSLMFFVRSGTELTDRPVPARFDDGSDAVWFRDRGVEPAAPKIRIERKDGEVVAAHFEGTEDQERKFMKDLRRRHPDLVSSPRVRRVARPADPPPKIRLSLGLKLGDANRLVAKIGLGAGAALWGDPFVLTETAAAMRDTLRAPDGRFSWDAERFRPGLIDATIEVATERLGIRLPSPTMPKPSRGASRTSQIVICPVHRHDAGTAIFVHVLNAALPSQGVVFPGKLPLLLPAVVRQQLGGRPEHWDYDAAFFEVVRRKSAFPI
jgi:hypothetical protein